MRYSRANKTSCSRCSILGISRSATTPHAEMGGTFFSCYSRLISALLGPLRWDIFAPCNSPQGHDTYPLLLLRWVPLLKVFSHSLYRCSELSERTWTALRTAAFQGSGDRRGNLVALDAMVTLRAHLRRV